MPHEPPRLTRSKRSPAAEHVDAFEQTRLAGAVRADQQVPVAREPAVDIDEAAYAVDLEPLERHVQRCPLEPRRAVIAASASRRISSGRRSTCA